MQNGNGLAHGVTSTGAGKEHEGRNLPPKHSGNTMEVEHGKGEGMNLSEVNFSICMVLSVYFIP